MSTRTFLVGMGMGLMVGGAAMYAMRPKKPGAMRLVERTLKTMGDVADSVSELMGF